MSDWQPIASAPRDGTRILIYQPKGQHRAWKGKQRPEHIDTAYWHQPGNPEKEGFWCASVMYVFRPTHWQPLPEPPKGGA